MENMKKVLITFACAAIPAAVVAACVKAANRIVDTEVEGDDAESEVSIEHDDKPNPPVCNVCKWWTGSHVTGDHKLHDVSLSTTSPLTQSDFEEFTRICREYQTAEDAVRKAMELLYSRGYVIVRTYVYDS